MPKYDESDNGKVIDGAIVVWLGRTIGTPGVTAQAARSAARAAAASQAAALESAAVAGVPFCQRCDSAPAGSRKKSGTK